MDHLTVGGFCLLQEDLLCGLLDFEVAKSLQAVHDALLRVLVNGNRDEFGLSNADDGSHDQHRFSTKCVSRLDIGRDFRETKSELRQC